jgi:geranylgeranyl pyrophosphate synthase
MNLKEIEAAMAAVDEKLVAVIDSEVELLNEASRHILTSGGKRIRPQMALLSYMAVGGQNPEEAVPMATAVEMVHSATLVHDDINDHSLLRRGRPAVHARWGRTFALLTGDYLFTKVYELMAPYGPTYNIIMADACSKLVEGETLQAATAKAGSIDRETYKRIVALKTASLFESAARMGALLGGGTEDEVAALGEYAYNLGVAFQIIDDVLDVIGDPETLGKPVATDLTQGRGVMIANRDRALLSLPSNGEAVAVAQAATAPASDDPIERMMAQLRESGSIELAKLQAYEMAGRARAALERVPPSPARDYLDELVDLVVERDR